MVSGIKTDSWLSNSLIKSTLVKHQNLTPVQGCHKKGENWMGMKQNITIEVVKEEHQALWDALREKWGNVNFGGPMPNEGRNFADKALHAMYVLEKWDGSGSADRVLSQYGIPTEVREYVIGKYCDSSEETGVPLEPKTKIADKYKELDQWAFDHPLEQATPDDLVEISGLSYASVMKYVKGAPRYKKVKNGLYEAFEDQNRVV